MSVFISWITGSDNVFNGTQYFANGTNATWSASAPSMWLSSWFMAGCVLLAALLMICFNTNYKRLEVRFRHLSVLCCCYRQRIASRIRE